MISLSDCLHLSRRYIFPAMESHSTVALDMETREMVIVVLPMQFAGSEDVIKRGRCFGTLSLVKHDYDYDYLKACVIMITITITPKGVINYNRL